MGKHQDWHVRRSNGHANPRDRRTMESLTGESLPHRAFFVPAFSVRRPLYQDEVATEFHERLEDFCRRKPYRAYALGRMGITVLDKSRFVDMYHRADVAPQADDVLALALNARDALGQRVRAKPHLLSVPMGRIAVFGKHSNKIAGTMEGWKGFDRRYASKTYDGSIAANAQLVGEINSVVGEVTQWVSGGINGEGDYVSISTRALQRQAPHFTFAEKLDRSDRPAQIGNSERVDIDGQVGEFMPPELKFFDPVVHLQLQTPGSEKSPYTNNPTAATVATAGLFVRRPKFDDFGGQVYEAHITGGLGIAC